MRLQIGSIVLYNPARQERLNAAGSDQPKLYPAIVTHVRGALMVNLFVMSDGLYPVSGGLGFLKTSVPMGEGREMWRWPDPESDDA